MDERNARKKFIREIGLDHDPFETPVAEQELTRVRDIFYSYFSPPVLSSSHEELLKILRRSQPSLLLGLPGSGKSTLRLTLEADCRTVLDGTLAITYILGEDIEHPLSPDEHGKHLARAASIDLTLAVIEQFNPLNPPTTVQIEELRKIIPTGGRQLQRLIQSLLEKMTHPDLSVMDPVWGISREWKIIGKAPVKYVGASQQLMDLLEELIIPEQENGTGWEKFWQALQVAKVWGFHRFLILIDGVDARQRNSKTMMDLLTPLLKVLTFMNDRHVYFKMFLPVELEKNIKNYLRIHWKALPFEIFFSIMEWDDPAMRRLLAQRFRAAMSQSGPRYTGLDNLAPPNLNLDKKLIDAAQGSPRHLLGIVSDLIDIHVARDPDSIRFDRADWEAYRKKLESDVGI